jgi:mannose-6-phosphate isomerase-like protein (cupin superfamily)
VLVLTGAPGSGKSSVLGKLTTLLELDGVPHGALECEQLAWGLPLLPARDWISQLASLLAIQARAGRDRFLLAATVESGEELRGLVDATNADRVLVVCLTASDELVAARVAAREPDSWPGKKGLISHARELARSIPEIDGIDMTIDTEDRRAEDVATEILMAIGARGLLGSRAGPGVSAGTPALYAGAMGEPDVTFAKLQRGSGERFQPLRRELGVHSLGMNLIVLQPRQRGRIHAHEHQEEIYLVLGGVLTLLVEGVEHRLGPDEVVRVGPAVRRQLVNAGTEPLVVLALGGAGEHIGRDGRAWDSWEQAGEGRPPQEVALPGDLPAA